MRYEVRIVADGETGYFRCKAVDTTAALERARRAFGDDVEIIDAYPLYEEES